jgi:hypothetical protein
MSFERLEADGWNVEGSRLYCVCSRRGCRARITLQQPINDSDPTYDNASNVCVVVQNGLQDPYCSPQCLAIGTVEKLAGFA